MKCAGRRAHAFTRGRPAIHRSCIRSLAAWIPRSSSDAWRRRRTARASPVSTIIRRDATAMSAATRGLQRRRSGCALIERPRGEAVDLTNLLSIERSCTPTLYLHALQSNREVARIAADSEPLPSLAAEVEISSSISPQAILGPVDRLRIYGLGRRYLSGTRHRLPRATVDLERRGAVPPACAAPIKGSAKRSERPAKAREALCPARRVDHGGFSIRSSNGPAAAPGKLWHAWSLPFRRSSMTRAAMGRRRTGASADLPASARSLPAHSNVCHDIRRVGSKHRKTGVPQRTAARNPQASLERRHGGTRAGDPAAEHPCRERPVAQRPSRRTRTARQERRGRGPVGRSHAHSGRIDGDLRPSLDRSVAAALASYPVHSRQRRLACVAGAALTDRMN